MSLVQHIHIAPKLKLLYYNIIGISEKEMKYFLGDYYSEFLTTDVRHISELSPFAIGFFNYLPESSWNIDEQMQEFLYKSCYLHDESNPTFQANYVLSYIRILRTVSHLNLLPDNSQDYRLHFERLNNVLYYALASLNQMSFEQVINLNRLIENKSINDILTNYEEYGYLVLLLLNAMNIDSETPDYEMFTSEKDSYINWHKLSERFSQIKEYWDAMSMSVIDNIHSTIQPRPMTIEELSKLWKMGFGSVSFNRMSYLQSSSSLAR